MKKLKSKSNQLNLIVNSLCSNLILHRVGA